ncbi:DUF58 domain-containing protein [Thiogranum longum]|nr:DUF58 domain-containing protein [Thiogranum longum]
MPQEPASGAVDTRTSNVVQADTNELIQLRLAARNLTLDSSKPARSVLAGAHRSRFRGRGMDYLESRGYQPGDDIRNMDWRVTARSGHPHVKVYEEERERPVVSLVDLSPGMFFATRGAFKSVVAARAAALIGWATVRHGDRCGALLFNGGHHELRPMGGQRGVLRLIRALVPATDPSRGMVLTHNDDNHLNGALERLRRVARPGSLVFILSDFYAINNDTHRHLKELRKHNDVVACQIFDVLETEPPPPGRYPVTNGEQTSILDVSQREQRERYARYFAHHHHAVRELMQQCAIPLLRISTTDNVADSLRNGLANSGRAVTPAVGESAA